ncbi:hypothetical protein DOTSEDRAFT_25205 [Dothistroma septosporum NZE10]|uniref:Uncharacterized protein n=1 Tax=Dothistroma septosporum (strain NZE10 / CBS 128990) TaxID=675120 RepID=M2WMG9_DOTSN|nr:hypothetical protein DOTSEDRAFT_25205 [Dothistroma septosporum NZE10]
MATTTLDTRSPNVVSDKIKKYPTGIIYIVDDVDEDAVHARVEKAQGRSKTGKKRQRMTEHEENCVAFRDFFQDYSDYEVQGVVLPDDATNEGFMAYWKQQIATWTEDTFAIVYYHGDAGNAENKVMESDPGRVNAFKLISLINGGEADALLLLDCFIQDPFTHKKDGFVLRDEKDFTSALIDNLTAYVDEIKDRKRRALRSVLQIMGEDKSMYSSPKRIGLNQTRPPYTEVVRRFKLDPCLVALDEKTELFGERIQGPPENLEKFVEDTLFMSKDEGFEGSEDFA